MSAPRRRRWSRSTSRNAEIVGDVGAEPAAAGRPARRQAAQCRRHCWVCAKESLRARRPVDRGPVSADAAAHRARRPRRSCPPDGIVCLDNGMYKIWFARNYRTSVANTLLLDNALATMGAGLPSAMMAALLHPERRVLAVCGDGGFMMNSQELETAVRLKLNLVVLILEDRAYGMIRWKQEVDEFPGFRPDLRQSRFRRLCEVLRDEHDHRQRRHSRSITRIGAQGPVVTFSHGWPLSSDAWDGQMLFLAQQGFRVVAHDRRGHGRSSQASSGNDMDGYADDLAAVIEALDLKDATLVGHSTGGGEVARYIGRHGSKRVKKVSLIAAVPPLMLQTASQSRGAADGSL
jgi:hypothetical protein